MKAELSTIKIEMSYEDGIRLKEEIKSLILDLEKLSDHIGVGPDESDIREKHPKVNELLNVLNVHDKLPF